MKMFRIKKKVFEENFKKADVTGQGLTVNELKQFTANLIRQDVNNNLDELFNDVDMRKDDRIELDGRKF